MMTWLFEHIVYPPVHMVGDSEGLRLPIRKPISSNSAPEYSVFRLHLKRN